MKKYNLDYRPPGKEPRRIGQDAWLCLLAPLILIPAFIIAWMLLYLKIDVFIALFFLAILLPFLSLFWGRCVIVDCIRKRQDKIALPIAIVGMILSLSDLAMIVYFTSLFLQRN